MNYYEITKRQCDATLKIAESMVERGGKAYRDAVIYAEQNSKFYKVG